MHELSAAQGLLDAIISVAAEKKAKKAVKAYLEVGELTFLNHEQLRFAFKAASRGTIAEGCELEISEKMGRYKCEKCGSVGNLPRAEGMHSVPAFYCPGCGSPVGASAGRELFVKSADMEL